MAAKSKERKSTIFNCLHFDLNQIKSWDGHYYIFFLTSRNFESKEQQSKHSSFKFDLNQIKVLQFDLIGIKFAPTAAKYFHC
tara:strand:+ start:129 stop:374 length:246 start_codon:yes stop_codon:yes gene_type:complete